MSPIQKYHGEQDPRYGGNLQWPGANGFPFLGDAPPSLKQHEIDALPICCNTHQKPFDLNDEEDREYYNWVRDRIANGLFRQNHEIRRWPEDKLWPIVYLEWTQYYTGQPQKQPQGGSLTNANSKQFTLRRPN